MRRLDSDAHAIRVVRSYGSCKTVSVWPDRPTVSQRVRGMAIVVQPPAGPSESAPVMLVPAS